MVTLPVLALGSIQGRGRNAFTMIELIFAIVIIGITVLTVPMMIETNNKALENSSKQEAIFLISSVLAEKTALVWDNRSIVSTGSADDYVLSKMLDVSAIGDPYGRTTADSNIRVGGLRADKHRQFFDYNASNPTQYTPIGDAGFNADIDNSAADIAGYKQAYTVAAIRGYVLDSTDVFNASAQAAPTNLKMTEISIYEENGDLIAKLRAYTANIGEVDYAKRIF